MAVICRITVGRTCRPEGRKLRYYGRAPLASASLVGEIGTSVQIASHSCDNAKLIGQ